MIVDVALPIPVGRPFSYAVPAELSPYVFMFARVLVPFRYSQTTGVVVAVREGQDERLRSVAGVLDFFPLIGEELPALLKWSSSFYVTPEGIVHKHALPSAGDLERFLTVRAPGRADLDGQPLKKALRSFGRTYLLQLYNDGAIALDETLTGRPFCAPVASSPRGGDREERTLLIDSVEERLAHYDTVIADHLQRGGNILLLVPDHYAAGAWFTQRLRETFGPRVLWFSSATPVKQRMETWFRSRREGGYIVLGNKSCVFLPLYGLSLVIVERCDDDEYKNEEGFKFNSVRVAVERAGLKGASVVLASAACSIDAVHLARTGGFTVNCREWPERAGYGQKTASVPSRSTGEIIDRLAEEAQEAVREGMRLAIYTPRKDYGAYLKCNACKETLDCPACGGPLNYDRETGSLTCPACSSQLPYEGACPHCGSNTIGFSRIGTLFLEERLRKDPPGLSVTRITGDSLKKEIAAIRRLRKDSSAVLVGTQSLSKLYGFHVDKLILAWWDELRKMGGYRSQEKTHQVILNLLDALTPAAILSHSTGREPPDLGEYLSLSRFAAQELEKRKEAQFPPFVRVFLVQARAKTPARADGILKKVRRIIAEKGLESALFGTLPLDRPPYHIRRVILKGSEELLRDAFRQLYDIPGVEIEADPVSF